MKVFKPKLLILTGVLMLGCGQKKTEIIAYCANNPDDPLCAIPSNPCQLYPELYFYCVAVNLQTLEEVCQEYPDWDICDALTPENLCQLHPEWDICQPSGPNYPPVITASLTKSCGSAGEVITLDASLSNDPEGDTLSFSWEIVSGNGRFLTSTTSPVIDIELPPEEGDITVKLTVSDGKGGSDEETFVLHSMGSGIFVSPDGNDANSGTYSQPVSSITKALQLAYSNSITDVKLLEGEYTESVDFKTGGVRLIGGYHDEGGCWIRDYERYYTIISGTADYVLQMTSAVTEKIVVDGIYLSGATDPTNTVSFKGIMVDGAGEVVVKNSYIYGGQGKYAKGIWVRDAGKFLLLNSRVYGGKSTTLSSSANTGVKIENTYAIGITASIIDGGDTRGSSTTTKYIYGLYISGTTKCRIENSVIFGGRGYNSNDSTTYDFYTVGITLDSPCELYHNYIYGGDPEEDVLATYRSGWSIGVYLLLDSGDGLRVVNNIIDPGGAYNDLSSLRYGVYDYWGIAPGYIFKNNDIYSSVPYLPGDDPVLYYKGGGSPNSYTDISSLNDIDGAGNNFDGNLSVEPGFDLDGIHLTPISPLIDAGYSGDNEVILPPVDIDSETRPIGMGYDIGPDEVK